MKKLPYHLTAGQEAALEEILSDMFGERAMNRLLQGDVGSGKTVIALAAAYVAVKNGYQALFMVPTGVLAAQHYARAKTLFKALDIPLYLSTGEDTIAQRSVFSNAAKEKTGLFIGTHTLFQKHASFKNPALVICDEQHRFGVSQRAKLAEKGKSPHYLTLSATPIPRSLHLIALGDLTLSRIREKPPGRKEIQTFVVARSYEDRILAFLKKEKMLGHKSYVVCPRIDRSDEDLSYYSLAEVYERFQKKAGRDLSFSMLHGAMTLEEKQKVLYAFEKGDLDVLLSTTVVEVGVDMPKATVMWVMAAERFGLATLHQLRGRVGRGEDQSYCILLCANPSESALGRLKILTKHADGFDVAKKDLYLRGAGERYGMLQHGVVPELVDEDVKKRAEQLVRLHPFEQLSERERLYFKNKAEEIRTITMN